jgi:hypothetical protein
MARGFHSRRGGAFATIACALVAVAFLGLLGVAGVIRSAGQLLTDQRTGCPATGHVSLTVVGIDSSDPLVPQNKEMLRGVVEEGAVGQRGSRVIIARLSGSSDYRPEILFDRCHPGAGSDGTSATEGSAEIQDRFDREFAAPLATAMERLGRPGPESPRSHLTGTLERMVSDPALDLNRGERTLILLSDLIEHTEASRPYTDGVVRLPTPPERFLSGIHLRLVELPARGEAVRLQTHASRSAWREWCSLAGAQSCTVAAPGLLALELRRD